MQVRCRLEFFMGSQVPGPMCTSRVGDDWIDQGTMCLTQSLPPGLCADLIRAKCSTTPFPGRGDKSAFDKSHVYSRAKEAATKRAIDLQIIGGDYSRSGEISLENEDYLKKLIELGSGGKQKVSETSRRLQFYIIHGGGEGFLNSNDGIQDAGRTTGSGQATDGASTENLNDLNDIIAVFDGDGHLVSAAALKRPLRIPNRWSEKAANEVYGSWHNKNVSIYRNTYWFKKQEKGRPVGWGVIYLGLAVADGHRGSGPGTITIDIHKTESTNGCILIVDNNTPDRWALDTRGSTLPVFDKTKKKLVDVPLKQIDVFEPKLIVDILKAKGMKPEDVKESRQIDLGVMHVVEIK